MYFEQQGSIVLLLCGECARSEGRQRGQWGGGAVTAATRTAGSAAACQSCFQRRSHRHLAPSPLVQGICSACNGTTRLNPETHKCDTVLHCSYTFPDGSCETCDNGRYRGWSRCYCRRKNSALPLPLLEHIVVVVWERGLGR